MKVFIVTAGAYSDYRIVGVFSSREKAAECCPAAAANIDTADIEEWDMDAIKQDDDEEQGLLQQVFFVRLDADGNITHYSDDVEVRPRDWSDGHTSPLDDKYAPGVSVGYSVISKEHALKVAIEARQKLLREAHT